MKSRRLQSWFRDRHQHPHLRETKLKLQPQPQRAPMPKIHECDHCLLYRHKPYLICAVHPTGPNTNTCIDFRENPDAEPEELWEPQGASYYNGELILQRPAALDTRTTVRAAGHAPTVYRPVPPCEMTYPQYETPPVHWDCSACGWSDDSV